MLFRQPFKDTLFTLAEDLPQVHCTCLTSFNIKLHESDTPRTCCVGYYPVIKASPSELLTVYPLLRRSLQMADQLIQHDFIVPLDQAIYAKALEVICQNQEQFRRLVLRLGSFHTMRAFVTAIDKWFGDAGLADSLNVVLSALVL